MLMCDEHSDGLNYKTLTAVMEQQVLDTYEEKQLS